MGETLVGNYPGRALGFTAPTAGPGGDVKVRRSCLLQYATKYCTSAVPSLPPTPPRWPLFAVPSSPK